jgi:murein L,D-transpeptidase YafK
MLGGCRSSEAATGDAAARDADAKTAPPAAAAPAFETDDRCPRGFGCDLDAWHEAPRPRVDLILIEKHAHRLSLVAGKRVVRVYGVALGYGGLGQKRYEGDGTTPIGDYHVVRRLPSKWHTYLALDYPNDADRRRWEAAKARGEIPEGKGPGSSIAIHGHRSDQPERLHKLLDWTLGCVALDRAEIDEVADAAPVGTHVRIVE